MFIGGAITFIEGAMMFVEGAMMFVGEGGLVIGRLFKAAEAGVVDNIKGVNRRDLRWWLIIYKLKGPLLLINSLIFLSDYSVGLSLWVMLYSVYGTNLLFLLKTYTPLCWSSCLSSLIADL